MVVRISQKVIQFRFSFHELKGSVANTFISPQTLDPIQIFASSSIKKEKLNFVNLMIGEKELNNLKNVFYYNSQVRVGQTAREKEKLEIARRLIDPNEPTIRKKIEEKHAKLKKVKIEKIKKMMMSTVPFPRFLSNANDKSSRKHGGAFLKKLQQRMPSGHPIKTKVGRFGALGRCIASLIVRKAVLNGSGHWDTD